MKYTNYTMEQLYWEVPVALVMVMAAKVQSQMSFQDALEE